MTKSTMNRRLPPPGRQRGVVLIIALVMLVIISLLAAMSMRNATSSEAVSGNVRTTELATQAAEIALRYCEDKVFSHVTSTPGVSSGSFTIPTTGTTDTFTVLAPAVTTSLALSAANWDSGAVSSFRLPYSEVNQAHTTYKRTPECVSEHLPVMNSTKTGMDYTSTYQITARGFGPEVAYDAAKGRPVGSEVWLQSTITVTNP